MTAPTSTRSAPLIADATAPGPGLTHGSPTHGGPTHGGAS